MEYTGKRYWLILAKIIFTQLPTKSAFSVCFETLSLHSSNRSMVRKWRTILLIWLSFISEQRTLPLCLFEQPTNIKYLFFIQVSGLGIYRFIAGKSRSNKLRKLNQRLLRTLTLQVRSFIPKIILHFPKFRLFSRCC